MSDCLRLLRVPFVVAVGMLSIIACDTTDSTAPATTITVAVFDRGEISAAEGTMANNRWTTMINDRLSDLRVEFRSYPRREALQSWDLELAVNSAPDLMSIYWGVWLQQKAYSGHVLALDDLIEEHAPNYVEVVGRDFIRAYGTVEGRIFLLPSRRENTAQDVLWARRDWMENLGLDPPVTSDDFRELIRAFAFDDPNRSGTNDTVGGALNHRLIDLVFAAFGVRYGSVVNPYNVKDGTVVFAHEMPGFWPAVEYMRAVYEDGGIDPDFIQPGYDNRVHLMAYDGTLGVYAKNADWGRRLVRATREHTASSDWTVLPLFRTAYGHHPYLETFPASLTGIINARSESPEAVLRYVDFQAGSAAQMLLTYGEEGRHYRLVDGLAIEIDPELNRLEQSYASNSSYFILRAPGISSPAEAMERSARTADPILARGFELQGQALSLLGVPYAFSPLVLPTYLPMASEFHDPLKQFLEDTVIKAIVGGDVYTIRHAQEELVAGLETRAYQSVKTELNSARRLQSQTQ
jgi:putative aldouronate transport system substrate-binding protein